MWEYNFNDYLLYCNLFKKKANRYNTLLEYKQFLEEVKEEM